MAEVCVSTECVLGFGDVRTRKVLCGVRTIVHWCHFLWDISVLSVNYEVLAGFNGM